MFRINKKKYKYLTGTLPEKCKKFTLKLNISNNKLKLFFLIININLNNHKNITNKLYHHRNKKGTK